MVMIVLGLAAFALADHSHNDKVLVAIISAAGGMIGGALMMFQHQVKVPNAAEPTPAVDPVTPQKPPV